MAEIIAGSELTVYTRRPDLVNLAKTTLATTSRRFHDLLFSKKDLAQTSYPVDPGASDFLFQPAASPAVDVPDELNYRTGYIRKVHELDVIYADGTRDRCMMADPMDTRLYIDRWSRPIFDAILEPMYFRAGFGYRVLAPREFAQVRPIYYTYPAKFNWTIPGGGDPVGPDIPIDWVCLEYRELVILESAKSILNMINRRPEAQALDAQIQELRAAFIQNESVEELLI